MPYGKAEVTSPVDPVDVNITLLRLLLGVNSGWLIHYILRNVISFSKRKTPPHKGTGKDLNLIMGLDSY